MPGPPLYKGKFDAPQGSKPAVSVEELGKLPAAFEAKYEALLAKFNMWYDKAVIFLTAEQEGKLLLRQSKGKFGPHVRVCAVETRGNETRLSGSECKDAE